MNHQTGADFSGQWMLLVQWTQVHPFPHGNTGALSPSVQEFVEKVGDILNKNSVSTAYVIAFMIV